MITQKNKRKHKNIIRIISIIGILLLWGTIAFLVYPIIQNLKTTQGQQMFQTMVKESGIVGFLILFCLEIVQIFLIVLPAEPLEVLAGMCYGAWGGSIFILACVGFTTTMIFFFSKKHGKKFIAFFFGEEKVYKIENSKLFQNPNTVEKILVILFFITGTPKDLLVYIGALLPIKPVRFIFISTFCRIPSVISSTIAGEHLSVGNWEISLLVYGITFLLTGIVMMMIHHFDKDKIAQKAIEELK